MERRLFNSRELRMTGGAQPRIEGYAARFNVEAQLPGFREVLRRGAFTRAINEKQDVVCLFNHDSNFVLGRTHSGTLRLRQDDKGLYFVCDLPNTQAASDLHTSIQRGDISSCSFAFTLPSECAQTWSQRGNEVIREISDLNLHDVSPVTYPCYAETSVDARELELVGAELRSRIAAKPLTDAELIERGFRIIERWYEQAQEDKKRRRRLNNTILEL